MRWIWPLVAALLAACSAPQKNPPDAGHAPVDAAVLDAAAPDAATPDAAAVPDASPVDATSANMDASIPDAAPRDAGFPDAFVFRDAAVPPDATTMDASRPDAAVPDCLAANPGAPVTQTLVDGPWTATATLTAGAEGCARTFVLGSTAPRRDNLPTNPRTVVDDAQGPVLQSGNVLLDALFSMAVLEARENSVPAISDGAFSNGAPHACPPGGCFETGRLWTYAWTRDTSYSVDLGLGWLDAVRARNTLEFKLSTRRDGTDEQVVQDTGTGGSYPVSTDRVVWALGAQALGPNLAEADRAVFLPRARQALMHTVEHDRVVVFDDETGLYRGEQSFLDWREQSYPAWVVQDPAHVGMSQALSTNVLHLRALRWLAQLCGDAGEPALASRYAAWAEALHLAMRARFILGSGAPLSTYLTTTLDQAPVHQFDLLGNALAILADVVDPAEASAALSTYPHLPRGAPVIWPQQKETPIYHNRAQWPFVTAYAARAGAHVQHDAVVTHALQSIMRGAALNLSNMENLEVVSGEPQVDDGPYSGPVVNSQRQLWSVAAALSVVQQTLLGLDLTPGGLVVKPFIPRAVRNTWLAQTDRVVLNRFSWAGKQIHLVVHLPSADLRMDGAYAVTDLQHNGAPQSGAVTWAQLHARNVVEVTLTETGASAGQQLRVVTETLDYRNLFGPRPPSVTSVVNGPGGLRVTWEHREDNAADITVNVYRGAIQVADGLPGTTTFFDDVTAPTPDTVTHCYTVETVFTVSGNRSQHAAPVCDWGPASQRVQTLPASTFVAVGGSYVFNHGRFHQQEWGDPGHVLTATFTAQHSGAHLIQPVAANGAGPISTGITAGIKRVRVERASDGVTVGAGYAVMPHLGSWDVWRDGSFVRVPLELGVAYRVVVDMDAYAVNMSQREHFADYTGGTGGTAGAFHRVNIAELKVLALGVP